MRFVVTGAAGFIGSHLCEALVSEGHHVVGLDDLSQGSLDNLRGAPEVEFIEGDIRDRGTVGSAARGVEVILHQAAIRSVPMSLEAPELTTQVNVVGTMNVLLAAQEVGARVVSASSSSVYGDQDRLPVDESMTLLPRSPYAASKVAGEIYCEAWWRGLGAPTISLRYFNAFGPRQSPYSQYAAVIPLFTRACLEGERPEIHGDGGQSRDFTFVEDVVRGNLLAARADERAFGRAFNIGGGATPTSVNRVLEIIADLTGTDPDPVHTDLRPGDIRRSAADISRAREILGYRPSVSIEEGLRRTVEWFKTATTEPPA